MIRPDTLAGLILLGALLAGAAAAEAGAAIRQPPQPRHGPGGSDYTHKSVRVSSGGTGADEWYVFEPVKPRPRKAQLAVVMHGYGEYSGYESMRALIRHTVRKGSIVIYPRWQTDLVTPCPGPFDIEPCMRSAVNGIRGALAHLHARPRRRVQPQLGRTSYFGFSFGGIITANLANRHRSLQLPRPRAIFLDDPHDGGFAELGFDEPALDDSLAGIPRAVKLQCHSSEQGVTSEPNKTNGSCNAVFPKLRHIPGRNKDLVLVYADTHGEPDLPAPHGVCAAGDSRRAASASPTPTTGTSAGRCGTRCAAARSQAPTADTRSARRASTARSGAGATGCRSRR